MKIIVPNNRKPRYGNLSPFAEFRIILKRDGDRIVAETPHPVCFRGFAQFTPAEKDAYLRILSHVIDTAPAALRGEIGEGKGADNA